MFKRTMRKVGVKKLIYLQNNVEQKVNTTEGGCQRWWPAAAAATNRVFAQRHLAIRPPRDLQQGVRAEVADALVAIGTLPQIK